MRVRIRRFIKIGTDNFALVFLLVRIENCSALWAIPTGFTHFACPVAPRPEAFGLPCSFFKLFKVLILLMFGPSHLYDGTMASADPCRLNLTSLSGLL